jgi:hypothetical protein
MVMEDKYIGLINAPVKVLFEMVNLERVRLGWNKRQIKEFALLAIGKGNPEQFKPRDWINLTYSLRRLD